MTSRFQTDAAPQTGRRKPWLMVAGALLLAGFVPLLSISCRRSQTTDGTSRDVKQDCAMMLETAIEMALPEKLGVETQFSRAADRFNDWYRDCPEVKQYPAELGPEAKRLTGELLSKEEQQRLAADLFDEQDLRHIRNSLLYSRIAQAAITNTAGADLEQTVELFRYVVRNVELVERKPEDTPLTPFHVLLLGRGTAEDRAWIFVSLLRQIKLSAVLLTSGKTKTAESSAYLVGVPLNGEVYLFDTRLGLPIPTAEETPKTPMIEKPATLKQFVTDPKIAAGLNVAEFKYPLSSEDLQEPRVWLVGHRSLFSPRMRRLQYLKGIKWRRSVLFDWLDDDPKSGPGLYSRIVSSGAGYWKPEAVRIWPYPTKVFTAYAKRTDSQRSQGRDLMRSFDAPLRITVDKQTNKKTLEGGTFLQFRTRVMQWSGEYQQAITNYMNVRFQCGLPQKELEQFPRLNQRMMREADDDATYWLAVTQFEQGQIRECIKNLDAYIRTSRSRKWARQAGYVYALASLSQNKPATALTILDQVAKTGPQAHGNRLLWKRWDAIREIERKKAVTK